ncbi:MAG: acyl-CoA synthetase [Aliiglaciecola sp.]
MQTGDTLAILMRNAPEYLAVIEACRYVETFYVPLNWHASPQEIVHILEDSKTAVLIGHSDLINGLSSEDLSQIRVLQFPTPDEVVQRYALPPMASNPPLAEDLIELLQSTQAIDSMPKRFRGMFSYTSGSTGRPKGIKREVDESAPDKYEVYRGLSKSLMKLEPGVRFYVSAPMYHSAPNALSMSCIASGYADIYIEPKFDAEQFLADIDRYKITHTYIVPTMMVRLLKLPEPVKKAYDVSSLRFALSTGSACPADVKQAMIDWFGPIFYESYGASEIGFMTLISSPEAADKPGSVGKVLPGGSIKILDDDKRPLPVGESGSIYVYLPMFGPFKYTNAEGDLADLHVDGHTTVGDVGYLDEDGYLFINDRKKDMIISGGANIFPAEIEAVLIDMPDIADCAVFGAPHAEFGETIVVAVQCAPGNSLTLEQIHEFLEGKLARFKFPRKLDLHDALPREDSGKIFKQRLRAPYWSK